MNNEQNRKIQRIVYLLTTAMFFGGWIACVNEAYEQQENIGDLKIAINELRANNVNVEESLAIADELQQEVDNRDNNTLVGILAGTGCLLCGFGTYAKFDSLKSGKKEDYLIDEIEF